MDYEGFGEVSIEIFLPLYSTSISSSNYYNFCCISLSHKLLEKTMTENPTYKLRIVGHSIGAGCAVLLSM